jgi:hypothetical protein
MRYVQGERKDEGCIFCLAADSGDDEALPISPSSPASRWRRDAPAGSTGSAPGRSPPDTPPA